MTPEMMARVVMENYDPQFSARAHAGDVLVGGFNFGTGSSREQAVTCLKAKGIPLIIAASFSQTYLRNAYNNGFLCIEVPALVNKLRQEFANGDRCQREDDHPRRQHRDRFHPLHVCMARRSFQFPAAGIGAAVAGNRGRRREHRRQEVGI